MISAEVKQATGFNGQIVFKLLHSSGASAEVYQQGAHVSQWQPAAAARNLLFVSKKAIYAPRKAIRGGIPICFPQFADNGPLAHHGFLKTSNEWAVKEQGVNAVGEPFICFSHTDGEVSKNAGFKHKFEFLYTVSLRESELHTAFEVRNTDDSTTETLSMPLTWALHTYFAVDNLLETKVLGLGGREFVDKVEGRCRKTQSESELSFTGSEFDAIYTNSPNLVSIAAPEFVLDIEKEGCEDTVIWNIGKEKISNMNDMHSDEWKEYLCVESARAVTPFLLQAGASVKGSQTLRYKGSAK